MKFVIARQKSVIQFDVFEIDACLRLLFFLIRIWSRNFPHKKRILKRRLVMSGNVISLESPSWIEIYLIQCIMIQW